MSSSLSWADSFGLPARGSDNKSNYLPSMVPGVVWGEAWDRRLKVWDGEDGHEESFSSSRMIQEAPGFVSENLSSDVQDEEVHRSDRTINVVSDTRTICWANPTYGSRLTRCDFCTFWIQLPPLFVIKSTQEKNLNIKSEVYKHSFRVCYEMWLPQKGISNS